MININSSILIVTLNWNVLKNQLNGRSGDSGLKSKAQLSVACKKLILNRNTKQSENKRLQEDTINMLI